MKRKLWLVAVLILLSLTVPIPVSWDEELAVEMSRGVMESSADGANEGTLINWMRPDDGIFWLYGYSVRYHPDKLEVRLDQYIQMWPFLSLTWRRSESNFWIPSKRLGGKRWKLLIGSGGGYREVGELW